MRNPRFWLNSAAALVVVAGGALLSKPASATALFACSDSQIDYGFSAIDAVCGEGAAGSATITCTGLSVKVNSVTCA